MKFYFTKALFVAMSAICAMSLTSCDDDDDDNKDGGAAVSDSVLKEANIQFVNNTVIPTYKGLADHAVLLLEAVENMSDNDGVVKACNEWKQARQYWEWSEAFLFGAASNYGIDPHIDTWPFNIEAYSSMTDFETSNPELLGFHGVEYILFRDGKPRAYADLTEKDFIFVASIAEDLAVSAARLEGAWAGVENISEAKQQLLEEAEIEIPDNFGEDMETAGANNRWKTVLAGSVQILEGARTIVDEVAHGKIGTPHNGEDVDYIESPYSYNSIQDFVDNIVSVRNAYYGGLNSEKPQAGSLSVAIANAKNGKAIDDAVVSAIETAISAISNMKKPFVLNYSDSSAQTAISALETLDDALLAAEMFLQNK